MANHAATDNMTGEGRSLLVSHLTRVEPKAVPPRFNRCPYGPLVSFVGCRLSRQPAETAEPVKQSPEQTAQPLPRGGLSLSLSLLPGLSRAMPLVPLLSRYSPCRPCFCGRDYGSPCPSFVGLLALWVPCKDRALRCCRDVRTVHRGSTLSRVERWLPDTRLTSQATPCRG